MVPDIDEALDEYDPLDDFDQVKSTECKLLRYYGNVTVELKRDLRRPN